MSFFKRRVLKNKKNIIEEAHMPNLIDKKDNGQALIQSGRQQFKKLQRLGLQIPIAVL